MSGNKEKVSEINKIAVEEVCMCVCLAEVVVKIICSEMVWGLQNGGDFRGFV